MSDKKPTSLRLSPEAKRLLVELAKKLGVTQAAIIEIAIRRLAETEKVDDYPRS